MNSRPHFLCGIDILVCIFNDHVSTIIPSVSSLTYVFTCVLACIAMFFVFFLTICEDILACTHTFKGRFERPKLCCRVNVKHVTVVISVTTVHYVSDKDVQAQYAYIPSISISSISITLQFYNK